MRIASPLLLATVTALVATAASAADMLPLKHGIFVDKAVSCKKASFATSLAFFGAELNAQQVIGTITGVERSGTRYVVKLEAEPANADDTSSGDAYTWTLDIPDSKTFTLVSGGADGSHTYRWCFAKMPV